MRALGRLRHVRLEPLIRAHLPSREDEPTSRLMRTLDAARARGYLTRSELVAVCRWKSPRAIHLVRANSPRTIRAASRRALGTRSEERRLSALTQLRGVSVPMASAALTLLYPRRYGVVDIRVWQLLHRMGAVTKNPRGVGFTFETWSEFLVILRHFSRKLGVTARDVERALFDAHRARHRGRLYD